jgi:hypothetical protein
MLLKNFQIMVIHSQTDNFIIPVAENFKSALYGLMPIRKPYKSGLRSA